MDEIIKRTITFKEEIYDKLSKYANRKGITVMSVIRIAVSEFLERIDDNGNLS